MAHPISNPARRETFRVQPYAVGLDLENCDITRCKGTWLANTSASFRQGAPVGLNSSGEVVLFDAANGTTFLGVAKWSKVSLATSAVIDEEVIFGEDDATVTLSHAGLVANSIVVRSVATGSSGTTYAVTTDYTVSTTNGTLTHVSSGGSIDPDVKVYVSYTWSLTESDYQLQGKNFWQSNDYVTIQGGRVAVIQAPAVIFTTEFDTSKAYTLTGATSNVYANSAGLFSSTSSSAKLVGKVVQLPSASYPFLGIELVGQVAANS